MNKLHFLIALDIGFSEIKRKMGVTELNVAQIDFKASFSMPKFALISTIFGFPVSHACLLWVAGYFLIAEARGCCLGPIELLNAPHC